MKTTASVASRPILGKTMPLTGDFLYKTVKVYPNFSDVGDALALLNNAGFTNDQISLLGREQEHWQEKLEHEWDALKTAKGTLAGAALGSIPGLVLVTGIALTGGTGLLVAGPMVAAMTALGMGALSGSLLGGASSNLDDGVQIMNIEEQVEDAIRHGQWVIVAHSHNKAEALHAQELLPNSRTVGEDESGE